MKKLLLIFSLSVVFFSVRGQQYYVNVPVNDTLLSVSFSDFGYGCYPQFFTQSVGVDNNFFPFVSGLNVGFKITHNVTPGNLTTQLGVVNSGDTLLITPSQIYYQFYFASSGTVWLDWIVYGTPTIVNQTYRCAPWIATWGLSFCVNPGLLSSDDSCIVQPSTSTDEVIEENILGISPNPSTGIFTLSSAEKRSSIEIINVLGNHVLNTQVKNQKQEIDLSSHPKGIYFVKVMDEKGNFGVKKIVLQ